MLCSQNYISRRVNLEWIHHMKKDDPWKRGKTSCLYELFVPFVTLPSDFHQPLLR